MYVSEEDTWQEFAFQHGDNKRVYILALTVRSLRLLTGELLNFSIELLLLLHINLWINWKQGHAIFVWEGEGQRTWVL